MALMMVNLFILLQHRHTQVCILRSLLYENKTMDEVDKLQDDINTLVCETRNTVVITGFGPFKKHKVNASWEAVRLLPTIGIEKELNLCLITKEIPVSYEDVESEIPKLWSTYSPLLVIHVGMSDKAKRVTLEQKATKFGYLKEDIYGLTPTCSECCFGTMPIIESTLDIPEISNEINCTAENVQTELSGDAGRYLCEYIYYTSLSIDSTRSIFIHVPPLDQPYSAEQLANGIADIIRCLVRRLRA